MLLSPLVHCLLELNLYLHEEALRYSQKKSMRQFQLPLSEMTLFLF